MGILIHKPGLLSSFQDEGRFGHQYLGVCVCGAMDPLAHQMARRICGNTTDVASLEMTLIGAQLTFTAPCCLTLSGADMQATLDGQPLVLNRPYIARTGQTLLTHQAVSGTRCYLAVLGGFAIDPVMGSQSTYLRSRFGGWHGRALQKNDHIPFAQSLPDDAGVLDRIQTLLWQSRLYLPTTLHLPKSQKETIRVIRSDQWSFFTPQSQTRFLSETWRITPESERMGYRLQGPHLSLQEPKQMLSEAASFGTIQVPVGGQPIVLMADRQSTGGYPKIATVIQVDLPALAQKKPGDVIRFECIDLKQAQQLDQDRQAALDTLAQPLDDTYAVLRQVIKAATT